MEEIPSKRCPSCGGNLERRLENFSIGSDGGGGLLSLLADTYEVDLYACPNCGKVELYTTGFQPLSRQLEQRVNEDAKAETQVTCPVCGTEHSSATGCPNCALHAGYTSLFSRSPEKKKSRTRKPPWEK